MPLGTNESKPPNRHLSAKPKKKPFPAKLLLSVLLVVGLTGAGFVVFIISNLSSLSDSCASRDHELQTLVKQNVEYLNGLTILEGQHPKATGAPDGDCLTGKGGPATAVYSLSGKVSDIHAQITRNLRARGFEISPTFYNDGAGNTSVTDIWTTATDGQSTLELRYKLDPTYLCPETQPACAGEGIIERADLLNHPVREVSVTVGGAIIRPY